MATVSNLNPCYIELLCVELSLVESSQVELGLGFDNWMGQTLVCVCFVNLRPLQRPSKLYSLRSSSL